MRASRARWTKMRRKRFLLTWRWMDTFDIGFFKVLYFLHMDWLIFDIYVICYYMYMIYMLSIIKDVEAVSKKARQDDDLGTEHLQVLPLRLPQSKTYFGAREVSD